jgi:hypothetical protein
LPAKAASLALQSFPPRTTCDSCGGQPCLSSVRATHKGAPASPWRRRRPDGARMVQVQAPSPRGALRTHTPAAPVGLSSNLWGVEYAIFVRGARPFLSASSSNPRYCLPHMDHDASRPWKRRLAQGVHAHGAAWPQHATPLVLEPRVLAGIDGCTPSQRQPRRHAWSGWPCQRSRAGASLLAQRGMLSVWRRRVCPRIRRPVRGRGDC